VVRTRVGYTGGTTPSPTYSNLGDHSETIEIEFDPTQITYAELLDVFWQSHNPTAPSWSTQYKSAIFYHTEEQHQIALVSLERRAQELQKDITTEIVPAGEFTQAEDYHQKYTLQQNGELSAAYELIYPDIADFVASTAVARVNGYLGGNGSAAALEAEIDSLGLSPQASETLREIVRRSGR